jgi:hemerythrin-like domain-containing protein
MKPKTLRAKIAHQISDAEKFMMEQKLTEAFELIEKIARRLVKIKKNEADIQDDFISGAMERIELMKRRLVKEMARKL